MKGSSLEDVRLLQIFLSPTASPGPCIFEVSTTKEGKLSCTCPGYKGRNSCKHTRFVKARIDANNGTYPLELLPDTPEVAQRYAKKSSRAFREFVIKYAKIEVF